MSASVFVGNLPIQPPDAIAVAGIDAFGRIPAKASIVQGSNNSLAGYIPLEGELVFLTDTRELVVGDGVTEAVFCARLSSAQPLPWVTGRYYISQVIGTFPSPGTIGNNWAVAMPICVPPGANPNRVGLEVITAGVNSVARIGVYNIGADGLPVTRVDDSGPFSTDSADIKEQSLSEPLRPGWHALVGVASTTRSAAQFRKAYMQQSLGGVAVTAPLGWTNLNNSAALGLGFRGSNITTNNMPAVFSVSSMETEGILVYLRRV